MLALIAETSKSYERLIGATLALYGFECQAFEQGAALLDGLETGQPKLVVITTSIVDYDPVRLVQAIRQRNDDPRLAILVLSSREDHALEHCLLSAGANSYFLKRDFAEFERSIKTFADEISSTPVLCGKILYVEDSRSVADATRMLLEEAGHEVELYATGEEAYDRFLASKFDLVLADLNLAGRLTGLNLLRKIRALSEPEKAGTPVIAVSAYGDDAKRIQLFQAGVSDYVTKPVLNLELLARVQVHIRNQVLLHQLRESQEQLRTLAMYDPLTGLHNRYFLSGAVEKAMAAYQRYGSPISLLVLDLDHFKKINDQYGHQKGDEVLKATACIILQEARANDVVARYGGEEIVILLDHCQLADAQLFGERILNALARGEPAGLKVTASIGVAEWSPRESFERWFERADAAVYLAKGTGRNRVIAAGGSLRD